MPVKGLFSAPRPRFFLSLTADTFKASDSSPAPSYSIRLGRCLVFKVAGVLETWGVDEFIAWDWTGLLCAKVLANEPS